jgi:hypothetical protein
MKIRGAIVLGLVLAARLAHAQGEPGSKAAAPASSGSFDASPAPPSSNVDPSTTQPPAQPAPPAPDSGVTSPPAAIGSAPDAIPPAGEPSREPRSARVLAAPATDSSNRDERTSESVEAAEERELHARGFHVHDGFYLRLGLGAGFLSVRSEHDSTFKGWGVAPDIWIGGSPIPGLAIGVTLNGVSVVNPHLSATAADTGGLGPVSGEAPGTLTYSVFGVFADYYPEPSGGLHFMAGLNYSVAQFDAENGPDSDPASGVGLTGGLGYEWWIGRDWSVGPLARLHWASVSDVGGKLTVLSPVFLLGFTYH